MPNKATISVLGGIFGVLVYGQMALVAGGQTTLTLGPTQSWQGGAADGEAEVGYWSQNFSRFHRIAETLFQVSA